MMFFDFYLCFILLIVLCTFTRLIQSQTICYNPTTTCFDPTTTQSLLFQINAYTTCSRISPILQLNCVNGQNSDNADLCSKYANQISTLKCDNSGIDDKGEVIWNCQGSKPSNINFGTTTVSCEGCTSPLDKLKITGSCAIFYQLTSRVGVSHIYPLRKLERGKNI